MLGGWALPPLHPPCWPAVGRRGVWSASEFGRLILIMIIIIINGNNHEDNNKLMLGGGALPPAPPLLAGRWPAERLERFAKIVGCNE